MSQYYRTLMQGTTVSPYLANLIAYYKFDANANDFSVAGNNGSIIGSPTFVAGKVNNAINFGTSGTSNYVEIPDDIDFSFTDGITDLPFTISCWINATQFSGTFNTILRKRGTGQDEYQFIIFPTGRIEFYKFGNGSGAIYQLIQSATSVITTATWYNIVITNAGGLLGGLNIYVNGTLLTSVTRSTVGLYTRMVNGTANTTIGVATGTLKHRGLVDEFYIWKNRELTSVEALDIYNKGNAGQTLI